jgi:5S rRNA maturation endonuclease (ribonuclease M5)
MPTPEPFRRFLRTLSELKEATEERAIILVEGERDRSALRRLGVDSRSILLVHQGLPLPEVVERVVRLAPSRVILLTDWDGKGGRLAERLAALFQDGRLVTDVTFRRRLALDVLGEVRCVEDLVPWAERASTESGAPLDHWLALGA